MHVLVIAQLFPPDMGGGSTRAYNVVKGLTSLGHKTTVIAAFPHYPTGKIPREYRRKLISVETVRKAKVIRVWVPPVASKGLARRLVLFISFIVSSLFALPFVGDVDVLWAANPNILSGYSALGYSFFKRCPVVQNVDDLWPEVLYELGILNSRILRKVAESISRLVYAVSKAITPISPAYVDTIVNKYEVDPQNVYVIPAGVDLDNFKVFAAKHEKEGDTFKVLYIGALSPAYDFDYVLKAASLLSSESRIKFIIQGEGELGDSIRFKVREMNLHNVDIVLKVVTRGEVAEILSSADVLLLPLRNMEYTGISSKLYEYQASGKPIICCARGQPAEYVSKTNSGIVVDPGDNVGLSKSILFLFSNRKTAKAMGEAGKRYVENNLSSEKVGREMESVFNSLLQQKPRNPLQPYARPSGESDSMQCGTKALEAGKLEIRQLGAPRISGGQTIKSGVAEAEIYDEYASRLQRGEDVVDRLIYEKVITLRKKRLISNWLPKKRCFILDYGCGNGELSQFLANLNHEVIAFDLSKGMIRYARSITDSNKISFLVASGENLPLRDEVFDVVIGIGIFHHLHLLRGLEECHRSLKPNGALKLMEPNTLNPFSFIGRKIFRTSIHTPKERTYTLWFLRRTTRKAGFDLVGTKMISFVGYVLAFLSAWLNSKKQLGFRKLVPLLRKSTTLVVFIDKLCESLPLLRNACWIIAMNMKRS